jgi:GDP-L-fucose synthase
LSKQSDDGRNVSIYVAGHKGMVGSAIVRRLIQQGHNPDRIIGRTHEELDLTDQSRVRNFFEIEKPTRVYLAAARVGGIHANNTYPAEFIYDNLMVQANVIDAAYRNGVERLLFLGSSCIYPKLASQPMAENALMTGLLEPTNEPYAVAKIAGIKLCESYNRQYGVDYRSVMPTNLYGPGDNYHPVNSHVIPALIRKFHEAKISQARSVSIWGSGRPFREFLYVDDMANACTHVMDLSKSIYEKNTEPMLSHINIGFGEDVSIGELARIVGKVIGYSGLIEFDSSKPDGSPRKLLDSSRLKQLGWAPLIDLEKGLTFAYHDFLKMQ